jgi:hypothetical protein
MTDLKQGPAGHVFSSKCPQSSQETTETNRAWKAIWKAVPRNTILDMHKTRGRFRAVKADIAANKYGKKLAKHAGHLQGLHRKLQYRKDAAQSKAKGLGRVKVLEAEVARLTALVDCQAAAILALRGKQ